MKILITNHISFHVIIHYFESSTSWYFISWFVYSNFNRTNWPHFHPNYAKQNIYTTHVKIHLVVHMMYHLTIWYFALSCYNEIHIVYTKLPQSILYTSFYFNEFIHMACIIENIYWLGTIIQVVTNLSNVEQSNFELHITKFALSAMNKSKFIDGITIKSVLHQKHIIRQLNFWVWYSELVYIYIYIYEKWDWWFTHNIEYLIFFVRRFWSLQKWNLL